MMGPLEDKILVFPTTSLPDVKDIANKMIASQMLEDAFYICDLGDIVNKHLEWKRSLPRIRPFYAIKCNGDNLVLQTLKGLGTGFDCASKGEILKMVNLGVQPKDIIFANPTKPSGHIRSSKMLGVDLMTFDNEMELYKIKQQYPEARLVIRIRCNDENVFSQALGVKFGAPIPCAMSLLRIAKKIGVNLMGVSFHIGSAHKEPELFYSAIKFSRQIFDAAQDLGFKLTLLDIGGGIPGHDNPSFKAVVDVVNTSLTEFFPEDCGVEIIAEPGRYYVTTAFTLMSQVHSIRKAQTEDGSPSFKYYINDGVYGTLICVLIDPIDKKLGYPETLLEHPGPEFESSIWGPTLDGIDKVCGKVLLPKLSVDDWMVFKNMGAYSLSAATTFNSLPIPKVHYVADRQTWDCMKKFLDEDHILLKKSTSNNCDHKEEVQLDSDIALINPKCIKCSQLNDGVQ